MKKYTRKIVPFCDGIRGSKCNHVYCLYMFAFHLIPKVDNTNDYNCVLVQCTVILSPPQSLFLYCTERDMFCLFVNEFFCFNAPYFHGTRVQGWFKLDFTIIFNLCNLFDERQKVWTTNLSHIYFVDEFVKIGRCCHMQYMWCVDKLKDCFNIFIPLVGGTLALSWNSV